MCSHSAAPHCLLFHYRARHTWFALLSVCHTDLAHSALAPSMHAVSVDEYCVVVVVVVDTGSDVTMEITAHIAKHALEGVLHGNHSMSSSRGFVKRNVIVPGWRWFDLESQCVEILLLSLPSHQMSLILMNTWSMAGRLGFG